MTNHTPPPITALVEALESLDNWLVIYPFTTSEDFAQSAPDMHNITSKALTNHNPDDEQRVMDVLRAVRNLYSHQTGLEEIWKAYNNLPERIKVQLGDD